MITDAIWKSINFLFGERCGYPVPGVHKACHLDMTATHNGMTIPYHGGWHDAGDMAQFASQTAEITTALFEAATNAKENSMLYLRLLEEARWGLDFILRTRFPDGYRAMHADAVRYTDNILGTFDDIPDVDSYDHPLYHYYAAICEGYGGEVLKASDYAAGLYAIQAAREDYAFAKLQTEQNGFTPTSDPSEHSYPTGEALFYAIASVAASVLYQATGEEEYALDAVTYGNYLLESQETDLQNCPIIGFFYRDRSKQYPQHFNHQSREHYFTRALLLLCQTQADHPDQKKWENALRLYADYLKALTAYTAPYGMLPSGVYAYAELHDPALFAVMHPGCVYEDTLESYQNQLQHAVRLNERFCLRCYPIWFSFRGNTTVLLESGKSATMLGRYFADETLLQIGREQIYWLLGKNPSVQSNMYGHGCRYPSQYAISAGELTGALPVGMQSYQDEDIPYLPQGSNCTYKEMWTAAAGKFLAVAADLCHGGTENE